MKIAATTLSAALLSLTLTPCQTLPEGYTDQLQGLPVNAGNVLALSQPDSTAWFDGTDLKLRQPGSLTSLLTFSTPVFGSFTLEASASQLLFGESSTGDLWLVPLNGTPPALPIANLVLNYDAVLYRPNLAIVSAKTSGFAGQNNDLFAVDLTNGNTQLLAQLPGASGPVALDANGDLYYATSSLAFPTPPGQTDILRFSGATVDLALLGQRVLTGIHAQTVVSGLDSASDLAFDDDGDLFFVDWLNGRIGEIDDVAGPSPTTKTLIDYGTAAFSGSGVQFLGSSNQGVLEPFQPLGRTLRIHESSFGALSQVRVIEPAPAPLTANPPSPIPAGAFALEVTGGPRNGFGLIAIALPGGPGVIRFAVAGFEQPLFWHQGLAQPANAHFVTFDAAGNATVPLTNPGFGLPLGILAQGAFVDPTNATIGATGARSLILAP